MSGGARSSHKGWCANDQEKFSAEKRKRLLDKKQCSLFSFQEVVETLCVKGNSNKPIINYLSYHLPEGEGGMQ